MGVGVGGLFGPADAKGARGAKDEKQNVAFWELEKGSVGG